MIDLNQCRPFATGANRRCYAHPARPEQCLKVLIPEHIERRFQRQPMLKKLLGKQRLDDNRQEAQAYLQAAVSQRLGQPDEHLLWIHLPRFYGTAATSLGLANVSELITDSSGNPAQTLEHYLSRRELSREIELAIDRFCRWLISIELLTRNLLPHNLVVSDRTGQPELYLVDGLGAPAVQQLLAGVPGLRRRYIERKVRRFQLRIQWELSGRPGRWETAQKL